MAPIIYPTVDELIETNRRALIEIRSKKADSHHVLSRPLLIAALKKVEAESGDLYDKAAVLLTELVRAHAFASGVRRTAYVATMSFLRTNGQHPSVIPDPKILTGVREGFLCAGRDQRVVERECNPKVYPFLTLHSLNR